MRERLCLKQKVEGTWGLTSQNLSHWSVTCSISYPIPPFELYQSDLISGVPLNLGYLHHNVSTVNLGREGGRDWLMKILKILQGTDSGTLFLNANVYTSVTLSYVLATMVQWWPTVITQQTVYSVRCPQEEHSSSCLSLLLLPKGQENIENMSSDTCPS